jgi:hypothetical protein
LRFPDSSDRWLPIDEVFIRCAHLPRRRLVTRRLAYRHGLDELTQDIDEGLRRLAVRVLANVLAYGVEDHSTAPDYLRLLLAGLLRKILLRR